MKLKIKTGATVQVITGSDKGKKGVVLEVDRTKMRIKVQGVRVQTHFDKKDGLLKKEGFIDYSNVKLMEAAAAPTKKKAAGKKTAKAKSAE
ncbi:MAG: KOW motif domain-containing protein [Bdellovibrionota bacterium]